MRIVVDDEPIEYVDGDSVAVAIVRARQHPQHGGTLCLAGDCGNCSAEIDGIAFTRTCLTPARPGVRVTRHPAVGGPPLRLEPPIDPVASPSHAPTTLRRERADLVVIGAGASGTAAAAAARDQGRNVTVLAGDLGHDVVGVYPGPLVVVRLATGEMLHVHAHDVVLATGAAELHPVCDGNMLSGIYTARAAEQLRAAGVDLGAVATVDLDDLRGITGDDGTVSGVVTADGRTTPCDALIVSSQRTAPRDLLARMVSDPHVHTVGPAAEPFEMPACPTSGTVCPCSKVTVDDLQMVWDKGFQHIELVKRASLCGTGTCQGSACMPHLRAFVTAKSGQPAAPFTGRPASRQLTISEAAADMHLDPFRRTALHDEHISLGARMDRFGGWWRPWNYGNFLDEYWAVREGVSIGDVSTLGKMIVTGPDVVEALERIYPTTIHDIRPGRSRYVLLLNERGHLIDDGMVCREAVADGGNDRFVLTFTSGGASFAEAWIRDWIETWDLDVHILDRTLALGAINVTGPLAAQLLARVGLDDPPRFLQHVHTDVAGVPCHVLRLSFTGEASFELHHPRTHSVELWQALMEAGRDLGIRPHGLQALFALRLEKGHVIVGMDTEMDSTPRRLDMEWAVKLDKADFIGRTALLRTEHLDDHRHLFGLTMPGPAPIEGAPIWVGDDIVGHVTSSFRSPGLGTTVMLGWQKHTPFADTVTIDGREARVTSTPFYDPKGARARA
ncbi:MAG TPA: glycine cleavage T C-terminal barrel domain-containing protein [Ilumatobacteraceae bacterium]|jgi:glycine cleavage system aminomethyltransferase T